MEEIKSKSMGIREACRFYGVPKTTVHDRLSGKVAANKKPKVGPDPVLGLKGEECLKNWVLNMARCGFPIHKKEPIESVSKIIRDSGIKNPFKDGTPGDTWYQSFLRRNPEISVREPEGINNARAAVTETRIRFWFSDLREYIKSIDALDIFEDPNRIFNGDETGFSLCPKSGKVLGPKGYKNLYIIKNNEKTNITVLVVFTASGKICHPLVIFPYIRPPRALIDNMPKSWVLGRSESGWMRSDVFYEYISNSFNTWVAENSIKKPVLLFVDGHKSHMSLSLSQFCEANGIILYALPANTTHMLQPADVSVFKPLKQEWKKTVRNWQKREENINQTVTKINFCKILNETLTTINLEAAIVNGFRKCGLYPLNEEAVDYTKCVKDTQQRVRMSDSNRKKNTVTSKDYDTAIKIISLIQEDISKHKIDAKIILTEIDKAKTKYLANRHSKSKTPRTSADSNQSTSILAEDVLFPPCTEIALDNRRDIEDQCVVAQNSVSSSSRSLNILTAEVTTDANITITEKSFQNISFLEPGSYISLNDISLTPFNEFEISHDANSTSPENQCSIFTVTADVHNVEKEKTRVSTPKSKSQISIHFNDDCLGNEITEYKDLQESMPELSLKKKIAENTVVSPSKSTSQFQEIIETEHVQQPVLDLSISDSQTLKDSTINNTAQTAAKNQTLTLNDAFARHLKFPGPPAPKDKTKSVPNLPSAISTDAWRDYYIKKDEDKENQVKEKKRKQQLRVEKKERIAKERERKVKIKKAGNKRITKKRNLKCSQCSEDLVSDVEDDLEKNIGCDKCIRWFHLKCTILKNVHFSEAANSDYTCPFCTP